jgi:hypothetical protein
LNRQDAKAPRKSGFNLRKSVQSAAKKIQPQMTQIKTDEECFSWRLGVLAV